ncbi:MAG TPA: radical SAM protein [Sulfurimonas sp.]|jgi:Fe-coproporphyrin III synthase|uniref:radical SAM/SPASM domain-containing protein n=1 Tax=Sulfurimonas sp. TaxID=2022749 RepID=UPI002B55317D|nr:radical SAM protein [Sulfurimonas sp.]HUH41903.1 radical SAM protein [Sulfurimonas sp.]
MFRLSNLIHSVLEDKAERVLNGSIAIWNFTNRCNLSCLHCYSKSTLDEVDTLTTAQIKKTILEMKANGVKFIIFSGGEPLTRKDLFEIADFCRDNGIITYLSSNGLYFTKGNVKRIVDTFNYVGISIDGDEPTHDHFRGLKGAFKETLKAVRLANEHGGKVGIRFTITKETLGSLEYIFDLAEKEEISKIYISHLVYSGRGLDNLKMDLSKEQRRKSVEFILDKAFEYYETGRDIEIVTGNMEQDAILFLNRFALKYPDLKDKMRDRLVSWGGNSAGRKLLNINSEGDVRPDPFFPLTVGNIIEKNFGDVWQGGELLDQLRIHPRKQISGICADCEQIDICNGGSRSRAYAITGDLWSEDPSCYLTEQERRRD